MEPELISGAPPWHAQATSDSLSLFAPCQDSTVSSSDSHPAWPSLWSIQSHLPATMTSENPPGGFHHSPAFIPVGQVGLGIADTAEFKAVQSRVKQLWRKSGFMWTHHELWISEHLLILGGVNNQVNTKQQTRHTWVWQTALMHTDKNQLYKSCPQRGRD